MNNTSTPGPQHERFTQWAKEQGIKINGVGPARISRCGLGIVAQRKVQAGEELVSVPASALLSIHSVSPSFRRLHPGISVHGLLASFLAFGGRDLHDYALWLDTWPSRHDFEESMPIMWPANLRTVHARPGAAGNLPGSARVLPPAIGGRWASGGIARHGDDSSGLLRRQEKKLREDWAIVSKVFPREKLENYIHCWLLVNTRSFYYDFPKARYPPAREDRMVLCPFVDYFNHSDHGCVVTFDAERYTVRSDRIYEPGEEIFVSYGNHSNDFLMVEYGFILDENQWDYLPIDDLVLHDRLPTPARRQLETAGYLGDYKLSREGVCHRTQVAIRSQTLGVAEWKKFVRGTDEADVDGERRADAYIADHILGVYYMEAERALDSLETADGLEPRAREMLTGRWRQIKDLITAAVKDNVDPQHAGLSLAFLNLGAR